MVPFVLRPIRESDGDELRRLAASITGGLADRPENAWAMVPFVLRPIRESDGDELRRLAASITGGLTSLPNDAEFLQGKIVSSVRSFDPRIRRPGAEYYLFVLEDLERGRIVGTSGLIARVGGFDPFYSYRLEPEIFAHEPLGVHQHVQVLRLKTDHKGPSEVCSLFLDPGCRRAGLGRLLSLGRFLFLRAFPERFDREVIAELRGYQTPDGRSPFWESVGRHFFGREFHEADFLSGLGNKDFIKDLMPRYPIYLNLLPQEVQAVVGRVHPETEPALRLLQDEGFAHAGEVDIFDAGPLLHAPASSIRTVVTAAEARARPLAPPAEATLRLIARPSLDFRAVLAPAVAEPDALHLAPSVLEALQIQPGDPVLHSPLYGRTAGERRP